MLDAQLLEYEDCDQPESLYYDYLRPDYVEVNISVVWLHKIKRIWKEYARKIVWKNPYKDLREYLKRRLTPLRSSLKGEYVAAH